MTEARPDIASMPFEAALAELEQIVDQLEKGAVALDESIRLYERGEALKKRCDELLKNAEMRIEKITLAPMARSRESFRSTATEPALKAAEPPGFARFRKRPVNSFSLNSLNIC